MSGTINADAKIKASYIGKPIDRVDGAPKVTGAARYAYEYIEGGKPAFGYILGASIARGRIASIDTSAASRLPGVLHVMTHQNVPPQAPFVLSKDKNVTERTRSRPVLIDDRIEFYDQPIALVVAETFEIARDAASRLVVKYREEAGKYNLTAHLAEAYKPARINAGMETDSELGDTNTAFASSAVKLDEIYTTAYQSHNPMEPHAALAYWNDDRLTVHTSTQNVAWVRGGIANTLQIPLEKVRVISRYIGGGFGNKLIVKPETIFAALASRVIQRPVKVSFTRQQMFCNTGHRPMMLQKVRLGADAEGKLGAISHEVISQTSQYEEFAEQTAAFTRSLYAAPNRTTRHRLVKLDMHRGEWMRAPGEAPGMLAIESAMDELAERLDIDPIELRVRNEPLEDPERKVPFSHRDLVGCMREGAQRFGWDKRGKPASRRDGNMLIGMGMSAAIRPNYMRETNAAVEIDATGRVTVKLDMTDIGTGTYTILSQVAAETLGVPLSSVTVLLGDSDFPETPGSGGSWGAGNTSTAVLNACLALKDKIAATGGKLTGTLSSVGKAVPSEDYKAFSQHTYGAHFAEVGVDVHTGEIKLRRMLGVFSAGRILNPKTARSQIIGGMIWGVSSALMEEAVVDARFGHFVNHDLAEYHVPVNADIPEIEVIFRDERDDKANPLGAKGIGELGICGAGASVANAIYNATGVRIREFPITLDKILPRLPQLT